MNAHQRRKRERRIARTNDLFNAGKVNYLSIFDLNRGRKPRWTRKRKLEAKAKSRRPVLDWRPKEQDKEAILDQLFKDMITSKAVPEGRIIMIDPAIEEGESHIEAAYRAMKTMENAVILVNVGIAERETVRDALRRKTLIKLNHTNRIIFNRELSNPVQIEQLEGETEKGHLTAFPTDTKQLTGTELPDTE